MEYKFLDKSIFYNNLDCIQLDPCL